MDTTKRLELAIELAKIEAIERLRVAISTQGRHTSETIDTEQFVIDSLALLDAFVKDEE